MVLLTCRLCKAEYYEKRFIWEPDQDAPTLKAENTQLEPDHDANAQNFEKTQAEPFCGEGTDERVRHSRTQSKEPTEALVPAVYGDAVRATGTMTNIVGSVANVATNLATPVSAVLAPVSAACGIVGFASGAYQLQKGFGTPSGETDLHLVAKGSTTAVVGGTCMLLGAAAAFVPALCLGAAGVCVAVAIDANVSGLCEACRDGCQSKATDANVNQKQNFIGDDSAGCSEAWADEEHEVLKGTFSLPGNAVEGDKVLMAARTSVDDFLFIAELTSVVMK